MSLLSMNEVNLDNKNVLIREDLNVPIRDGIITSDKRLKAALPTIRLALEKGANVILLSHLGRPEEGTFDEKYSLAPIADYLNEQLSVTVTLEKNYLDGLTPQQGSIILCENVRFNQGEKACDDTLAKKLAALCDVFVMDAFGTAHRKHASTYGIIQYAPLVCAGPLLTNEIEALNNFMRAPEKPVVAIVGGSKVSSKLKLLKQLAKQVDSLILGGGIANTFLKAKGYPIGASLFEPELLNDAKEILTMDVNIPLPIDVVVAKTFSEKAAAFTKKLDSIADDDMILDMGESTVNQYKRIIANAKTILWNGPIGVFEFAPFAYGTQSIAFAIAESDAFSIAGGGDTLAAIDLYDLNDRISYISTGGGAFLSFIENKTLPAIELLTERNK